MLNVAWNARVAGACIGIGLLLPFAPANAQPTQAQQNAIRSNCRSDYMANCSSVTPGGVEALQCLQRHVAKLSPGCRTAVNAITPPAPPQQVMPAPVHTPPPPSATPVAAPAVESPPPPAAPPSPRPQAPAHTPPARTAAAPASPESPVARACRSDFVTHCRGVQPGSPQAQQCLQRNAARLSAPCARALVAASSSAPIAAAAPPADPVPQAAPAPAADAPRQPVGPVRRLIRERIRERMDER